MERLPGGHQGLIGGAVDLVAEPEADVGELGDPHLDAEDLVEPSRRAIAECCFQHWSLKLARDESGLGKAELAERLGAAGLEERKVVSVVDNARRIGVREADPQVCRKAHVDLGWVAQLEKVVKR